MLDINFADGRNNGMELMIMESAEKADKVIDAFRRRYRKWMTPMYLLVDIYEELGIDENRDLLDADCKRLSKELSAIVRRSR